MVGQVDLAPSLVALTALEHARQQALGVLLQQRTRRGEALTGSHKHGKISLVLGGNVRVGQLERRGLVLACFLQVTHFDLGDLHMCKERENGRE